MTDPKKTVLVTGASAGFGAAITQRFAAEGARVIAAARRLDRLTALADEVDGDVLPVELDVQDQAAVESAIASLPAEYAEIDVLVNNADRKSTRLNSSHLGNSYAVCCIKKKNQKRHP